MKHKMSAARAKCLAAFGQVSALTMLKLEDKAENKAFHETLAMAKGSLLEAIMHLKHDEAAHELVPPIARPVHPVARPVKAMSAK